MCSITKKYFFILLIPIFSYSQQFSDDNHPLLTVDVPPVFSSCKNIIITEQKKCFENFINTHIQDNLKFPEEAFDNGVNGRVLLSFVIDTNGNLSNVYTSGADKIFMDEVKRIISLLPIPTAAIKNNVYVNMSYSLPVNFYLLSEFKLKEINIKKGSNVYQSPSFKSKIIFYTSRNLVLNGTKEGDFWSGEINNDGSFLGYIKDEDILTVNNIKYEPKEKIKKELDSKANEINSELNYEDNRNKQIENLEKNNENKSNKILDTPEEIPNSPKIEIDKVRLEYNDDISKLKRFEDKLNYQKEINRKIFGYNDVSLYLTNALNQLVKLLSKEIEIKYNILSVESPKSFINTKFEVKKIKSSIKRSNRYKEQDYIISAKFLNKNFLNFPKELDKKDRYEIINELKSLEYVILEEIKITDTMSFEEDKNNMFPPITQENVIIDSTKLNLTSIEAKKKITELFQLYSDNIINKEEYNKQYDKLINFVNKERNINITVDEAKKKLIELYDLFNQGLVSNKYMREYSAELKTIIEIEENKKIRTINISTLTRDDLRERILNIKSLYDQNLISEKSYEELIRVLEDILSIL
jgi:hypothetical protein